MPTKYEKMAGCLWGGAVGDALGAPVEFSPPSVQVRDYCEFGDGTGSITDDTQMTIFTLEAMLFLAQSRHRDPVENYFKRSYLRWYATQNHPYDSHVEKWMFNDPALWQRRAPGMTCLQALADRIPVTDSKGCGTIMRAAPCGLIPIEGFDAFKLGRISAEITHGHPTGILSAGFFADVISQIVCLDQKLRSAINHATLRLKCVKNHQETLHAVDKTVTLVNSDSDDVNELGEGWIAEEALSLALFFALRYENDFPGGVLAAANIRGDRDSVAAITGNLLGALHGKNAIPENWINRLREKALLDRIAESLRDFQ